MVLAKDCGAQQKGEVPVPWHRIIKKAVIALLLPRRFT